MLKFLRLHKGWLLAIFGSLLLIVFLVPQAISGISQASATRGGTWATVDGEKVTFATLDEIQQELRVIQAVGNPVLAGLGADRSPEHWYLLRREAERAGLHGGAGDGKTTLDSMVVQINQQRATQTPPLAPLTDMDVLGLLCQNSGASPQVVLETLARLSGVIRLTNLFAAIDRFSDRRLEKRAAEMLMAVSADVVVLDPMKSAAATTVEVEEAKVAEHFAAFADAVAGVAEEEGADPPRFGYRRPDRFKLEWMVIPAQAMRDAAATGGELDVLTLKRRFIQDPGAFGAPFASAERPRYEDYADKVRSTVLEEVVSRRLADLAKSTADRFAASQRSLARGSDGSYVVDESWAAQLPSFAEVAAEIAAEQKIPTPRIGSSGENWMVMEDLAKDPDLAGASTTRFGTNPTRLADLIGMAREFGREATIPIQVAITGPVLTLPSGDIVVFRLLAAEPATAETDLEAVREQVVEDLTRQVAFEALVADLPRIREQAVEQGLRAVAREFDTTVEFVPTIREADPQFLQSGFRISTNLPGGLGRNPDLVAEVVKQAMTLPMDRPIRELPESDRTITISDPNTLLAAVVRINDLLPLTREVLEPLATSPQFQATLMGNEFGEELLNMFSLEAIKTRQRFVPAVITEDEDGEPTADATVADATSGS